MILGFWCCLDCLLCLGWFDVLGGLMFLDGLWWFVVFVRLAFDGCDFVSLVWLWIILGFFP